MTQFGLRAGIFFAGPLYLRRAEGGRGMEACNFWGEDFFALGGGGIISPAGGTGVGCFALRGEFLSQR